MATLNERMRGELTKDVLTGIQKGMTAAEKAKIIDDLFDALAMDTDGYDTYKMLLDAVKGAKAPVKADKPVESVSSKQKSKSIIQCFKEGYRQGKEEALRKQAEKASKRK